MTDEAEALRLIDRAVLALQARQHPGRPIFYATERVRSEARQAQAALPISTPQGEGMAKSCQAVTPAAIRICSAHVRVILLDVLRRRRPFCQCVPRSNRQLPLTGQAAINVGTKLSFRRSAAQIRLWSATRFDP